MRRRAPTTRCGNSPICILTLQLLDLATALKAHCAEVEKRHGVAVKFAVDGDVGRPSDVAISLFRIAQESLRNGVAAEGATARGHAARSDDRIELTNQRRWRGLQRDRCPGGSGLGLVSMDQSACIRRRRARRIETGNGTTIRVRYRPHLAPPSPRRPADPRRRRVACYNEVRLPSSGPVAQLGAPEWHSEVTGSSVRSTIFLIRSRFPIEANPIGRRTQWRGRGLCRRQPQSTCSEHLFDSIDHFDRAWCRRLREDRRRSRLLPQSLRRGMHRVICADVVCGTHEP